MAEKRVRLCMTDLFHRELIDMVEREMRRFSVELIESADDPEFAEAFQLMWDAFGSRGEMEHEEAVRGFLADNPHVPTQAGTYVRYFILVAKNADGAICGVRDGCVLYNDRYDSELCVVYLARLFMLPEARGTALSLWLRIAPVEIAVQYLASLHEAGRIELPRPDKPALYYGMRLTLTAEMDFFNPDDRLSLGRILFYGRGGFRAINPGHFPYAQPDVRHPDLIRATGSQPLPFMILVRRMGNELEGTMAITEAQAMMKLLYDDFVCQCAPEHLEASLAHVLERLRLRAEHEGQVELLPLPTGRSNVDRLRAIFRDDVLANCYAGVIPVDEETLTASDAQHLDVRLAEIALELGARPPRHVFHRRNRRRS